MPDKLEYATRKAQRRCTLCGAEPARLGLTTGQRCGERERLRKQAWAVQHREALTVERHHKRLLRQEQPGPNLLACCGGWWRITSLPVRCGRCSRTYFAAEVIDGRQTV
jgi:hypothetical protein